MLSGAKAQSLCPGLSQGWQEPNTAATIASQGLHSQEAEVRNLGWDSNPSTPVVDPGRHLSHCARYLLLHDLHCIPGQRSSGKRACVEMKLQRWVWKGALGFQKRACPSPPGLGVVTLSLVWLCVKVVCGATRWQQRAKRWRQGSWLARAVRTPSHPMPTPQLSACPLWTHKLGQKARPA